VGPEGLDPPTARTTCAIVVTYNPQSGLATRLEPVLGQVDHVFVIDNASRQPPAAEVASLGARATLVQNEANLGVATALNRGCQEALRAGYRWALLLDDDSIVQPQMLTRYAELLGGQGDARIGLIGCNYWDKNRSMVGINIMAFRQRLAEWPYVITSGSLLNLAAFREAGPFRDDFFIDCIDFEYGFRLKAAGWRSLLTAEILMDHSLGKPAMHRFPVRKLCNHHSVARKYYWMRNRTVMLRTYREAFPEEIGRLRGGVGSQVLHTLLHERGKLRRLLAIALALRHAKIGRMGPAPAILHPVAGGER
jgi:rhamnosyltransferase